MCPSACSNQHFVSQIRSASVVRSRGNRCVTTGCSPLVEECSTRNWSKPLTAVAGVAEPVVVALGKFDGMHQGHRLLAQQAASSGSPFLLSFSGMAEVLGWPARLPLVAPSDRARVLASWTSHCQGTRRLVIARCCKPWGRLMAYMSTLLIWLGLGQVAESLGRPYRLVADISPEFEHPGSTVLRLPIKCLQNQPPMYQQTYQVSLSIADKQSANNEGPSKEGSMHMSEQGVALCKDLSIWLQQTLAGQHCLVALDF
ncbi:hypothetical protein ABBQ32_013752 [Trebouxia sp. C0010 RCD-2024]